MRLITLPRSLKYHQTCCKEFYNFAEEKGAEYDEKGASTSETIIRQRLKASIARNLFREKVFYQVVNEDDVVVKRATEKLSNN